MVVVELFVEGNSIGPGWLEVDDRGMSEKHFVFTLLQLSSEWIPCTPFHIQPIDQVALSFNWS